MPKKVLWFSRHEMTDDQRAALGDVEITQINKSINSAYELENEIKDCDILAIVAPINLQQQFLKLAGDKPVIMAVNDRVLIPQQDGTEDKAEFHFVKWEQLLKIEVVKQDFSLNEKSKFLERRNTMDLNNREIYEMINIALFPNTSQETLHKLSENENVDVKRAVAHNKNTSAKTLERLAKEKDINIRLEVANNENTPSKILDELAKVENFIMCEVIAKNRNTSIETLKKLAKHPVKDVKIAITENPNTPLQILNELSNELSNDEGLYVRFGVAKNKNTPEEILDKLSKDKDITVRTAVAKNKNTSLETLEKLVKDKDKLVSRTAKKSLDYIKSNLTIENEEKSLDLVDLDMVSKSAKNSLDEIIKNNTISNEKEQHDFQNKLYLRDERSI